MESRYWKSGHQSLHQTQGGAVPERPSKIAQGRAPMACSLEPSPMLLTGDGRCPADLGGGGGTAARTRAFLLLLGGLRLMFVADVGYGQLNLCRTGDRRLATEDRAEAEGIGQRQLRDPDAQFRFPVVDWQASMV